MNLQKEISDLEIKENVSIKNLTTFKLGGVARYVCYPKNIDELTKLISYLKKENVSYKVLGNGSNIIASDKDYDGIIIKLNKFNDIKIDNDKSTISVGAGYSIIKLASYLAKEGYEGFEWASGIPGTIGGAIFMNAGAYNKSISDIFLEAVVLDENLNVITLQKDELEFSYRKSILMKKSYICLQRTFKVEKGNKEEIISLIEERKEKRKSTQPLEYPSAGSTFMNPINNYAGKLIENCNLKGKRCGGAMISYKHANFVINYDNATGKDVMYLIKLARDTVYKNYGIELELEQELFNWE